MVIMYGSLLLLLSAPSAAAAPAHVRREGRRHDEVKIKVSVSPGIEVGRPERVTATLAYRRRSWGDGRVRFAWCHRLVWMRLLLLRGFMRIEQTGSHVCHPAPPAAEVLVAAAAPQIDRPTACTCCDVPPPPHTHNVKTAALLPPLKEPPTPLPPLSHLRC
jgi:hypothetical protein